MAISSAAQSRIAAAPLTKWRFRLRAAWQAHCPQTMTFVGDSFVHYGLGNLFFDQMDEVTRPEFLDRHIFYQGRYISTELLTAKLEDFSRPRPMTVEERDWFLGEAFGAAVWQ